MEENKPAEVAVPDFDESKIPEKYNLTDARISEMKEKASKLTIDSADDTEGYRKVKKAIQIVVKHRTAVENVRKDLKEPALTYGRAVDNEAKRITALLKPIEDDLIDKRNKHEKEVAANKSAEYERRRKEIVEAGYMFDGRYYTVGTIHLHPDTLENCSPDEFDEWISRAENEKKRIEESNQLTDRKKEDTQEEKEEVLSVSADLSVEKISDEVITPETHKPEAETQKAPAQTQKAASQSPEQQPTKVEGEKIQSNLDNQMLITGFNQCREQIIELLNNGGFTKRSDLLAAINALKPKI